MVLDLDHLLRCLGFSRRNESVVSRADSWFMGLRGCDLLGSQMARKAISTQAGCQQHHGSRKVEELMVRHVKLQQLSVPLYQENLLDS